MKKLLLLLLAVMAGATTAWAGDFMEILTNGHCDGTYDGWNVENGGDGWAIETDEGGEYYWASSYAECRLSQNIWLSGDLGPEPVDNGRVEIMASAMVRAYWESGSLAATVANVYVSMQDDDGNELSTVVVYDDLSIHTDWVTSTTTPVVLVPGTRKLVYIVRGKDIKNWGGHFGPQFKNLSLKIRVNDEEPMISQFMELLTNGDCDGTSNGWAVTNGGSGWGIFDDTDGSHFWASSYKECKLEQTVDLIEKGFSDTRIDRGQAVCVASALMRSPWEKDGFGAFVANVYVDELNADGSVLTTITLIDDLSYIPEWRAFQSGAFTLVSGTRFLRFVVRGQDRKYWSGQYGPQFKNLSLKGREIAGNYDCTVEGHVWGPWTTSLEPSCTESGRLAHTCQFCGLEEQGDEIPALGHDWGEWETSLEPTCTETGLQSHTCQRCGLQETGEPIPALGHEWGEWEVGVEPTCTEAGLQSHTCLRCGLQEDGDEIPALGHEWGSDGYCTRCGAFNDSPSDITLLNSIRTDGNQVFNTNYIHKANTVMELDCKLIRDLNRSYEALFGARLGDFNHNSFALFTRFGNNNKACFSRSGAETLDDQEFVYNERIKVVASGQTATWYRANNPSEEAGSVTTTGTADEGQTPMFLFDINTSSEPGSATQADQSRSVVKLYGCKIYEGDVLVHEFLPAKKNDVVGLYDRVDGTFGGSITDTPFIDGDAPYAISLSNSGLPAEVTCPNEASPGTTVEFSIKLNEGTKIHSIYVVNNSNGYYQGTTQSTLEDGTVICSFVMPDNSVTIYVNVTYENPPTPITEIPSDYTIVTYQRNSLCYGNFNNYPVEADGKFYVAYGPEGQVYIKNPSWYYHSYDVWVEGTYDETTGIISIPTGQYLYWNDWNVYGIQLCWGSTEMVQVANSGTEEPDYEFTPTVDMSVEAIEFLVDGDNLYLLNAVGNTNESYPDWFNATGMYLMYDDDKSWAAIEYPKVDAEGNTLPYAFIYNATPAIPAAPTVDEWYDCGDQSGFSRLYFTLPTKDTDGGLLDPELLSYSVFVDNGNGPEIYTFSGMDYSFDLASDESLTEIPYSLYHSAVDFHNNYVYMYRTNADGYEPLFTRNIGLQVYYTVGGIRTASDIAWLIDPDGISDIKADKKVEDDKVYNLAGQRLNKLQKGINIINSKKILVK